MPKKVMVLFAVVGLLALAFAAPPAGSVTPTKGIDRQHLDRDSIRMLRAREKGVTPPHGIDANKVIRQVRSVRKHGPPRPLYPDPFTGSEFMPSPTIVGKSPNNQEVSGVAFDGVNYLVVWRDSRNGSEDICGARVNAEDGTLLDPAGFVISTNTPSVDQYVPSVAFGGTNYLVVWADHTSGYRICGALVNRDGEVTNLSHRISDASDVQYNPTVASNGTDYLVAWEDWGDYAIYGALVERDGDIKEADIPISDDYPGEGPSVASDGDNYLVVWHDWLYSYGAPVDKYGNPGTDFPIGTDDYDHYSPSVASDGTDYLVVWCDYRHDSYNGDIYAAGVRASDWEVLNDTGFKIYTVSNDDQWPAKVAYDGTEYLVVWQNWGNGEIDGCYVTPDSEVGVDFTAIPPQAGDAWYPAVACGTGTALVTCDASTDVVDGTDYGSTARIWARRQAQAQPATDVRVDAILCPVGSFLMPSWLIQPKATVTNCGTEATAPFQVRFIVDGVYSARSDVPSLAADETYDVTFEALVLDYGTFTARCSTLLSGDERPGNDKRTAIFQGCHFVQYVDIADDLDLGNNWDQGEPDDEFWVPARMDDDVWGDDLNGEYENSDDSYLTSPTYEATANNPSIAFQHNVSTETYFDGGNFEYNIEDGGWTSATPAAGLQYYDYVSALTAPGWSGWKDDQSGWRQSVFTIPATDGQTFEVRWHFKSDGSVPAYGWLIDEVAGIDCDLYTGKLGAAGVIDTMTVWPNPVRRSGQVSYCLRKAGNVTVKLYDATGRLASQLASGFAKRGMNTATLDASKLARGVYFVKLESESDTRTTKVIIE